MWFWFLVPPHWLGSYWWSWSAGPHHLRSRKCRTSYQEQRGNAEENVQQGSLCWIDNETPWCVCLWYIISVNCLRLLRIAEASKDDACAVVAICQLQLKKSLFVQKWSSDQSINYHLCFIIYGLSVKEIFLPQTRANTSQRCVRIFAARVKKIKHKNWQLTDKMLYTLRFGFK